ncbi:MAG: hypothetical protein ACE5KU_06755 [Nitrososphaerales archaeon]
MNGPVDWTQRKEQFERNLRKTSPGKSLGDVAAPATVTIEIDHTETQFDRLGYLRCAKPKIGLGDQVLHMGIHRATVKLNEEKINHLSQLWSSLVVQNIKSHIYTQLKAVLSNRDFEKIKQILRPQLTTERRFSEISARSLAAEIRSRLEAVEPLYLDAHATECKDLMIPYGAELTVTTKGVLKIVRRFSINRSKKTVKWRDRFDVSGVLNVDASLDPSVTFADIEVRGSPYLLHTEFEEKDQSAEGVEQASSIAEPLQNSRLQEVQMPPQDIRPTPDAARSNPKGGAQSEPRSFQPIKSISEGASQLIRFRKEEEHLKHRLFEIATNVLKSIDEPICITPHLLSGHGSNVKEAYISSKGVVDMTLSDGRKTTVKLSDLDTRTFLKIIEDISPKIRSKKVVTT